MLERLLPMDILFAAGKAGSTRRESATRAADAEGAGASGAVAKVPLKASLRSKAGGELWEVLRHAELRGSTFDVLLEVADWRLAWEPWQFKGAAPSSPLDGSAPDPVKMHFVSTKCIKLGG